MLQSILFMALLAIGIYLATVAASVVIRGVDNGEGYSVLMFRGFVAAIGAPVFWAWFITFVLM